MSKKGYVDEAIELSNIINNSDKIKLTNLCDELIRLERFDEARDFYTCEDCSWTFEKQYSFIFDVVNYYCSQGKKNEARNFLKESLPWFVSHVDADLNPQLKEENPQLYQDMLHYKSTNVKSRLTKYIDEY